MVKISPITLSISAEVWKEFCNNVPDTRKKNGTIVELIKKYNKECKENENRLSIR